MPCINTATSCCRDAGALHDGSYFSEFWRPKTNTSQPRVGIERKNAEKGRGQMQLQYAKYVNTSFRAQAFEGAFSYSSNIFSKKEKNLIDLSNRLPCIGLAETRTARAKSWSKKGRRPGPREEGGADGGRREFLLGAPRNA